jgi:hypothetical protein
LKEAPKWNQKNINYETPLVVAVDRSHENVCKALVDCGTDVHYEVDGGVSACTRSIDIGNFGVFTLLLRAAILPFTGQIRENHYMFLIEVATRSKKWDILEYILEFMKMQEDKTPVLPSLLTTLVEVGHYRLSERVFQDGMIPNTKRKAMLSNALILTVGGTRTNACFDHIKTVDVLLKFGAPVNTRDTEGSPLFHAVNEGLEGTAELLMLHGAGFSKILTTRRSDNFKPCKNSFPTILALAIKKGYSNFIGQLLARGSLWDNRFVKARDSTLYTCTGDW